MYQNRITLIGFLGSDAEVPPTTTELHRALAGHQDVVQERPANTSRPPNGTVASSAESCRNTPAP